MASVIVSNTKNLTVSYKQKASARQLAKPPTTWVSVKRTKRLVQNYNSVQPLKYPVNIAKVLSLIFVIDVQTFQSIFPVTSTCSIIYVVIKKFAHYYH